jgi:predicted nucleic acid-binding protein
VREYFDTPVFVFACGKSEFAQRARMLIAECSEPVTTPHALAECFNALTYRLGLSPADVRKVMRTNLQRFTFISLDSEDYLAALDRVVENGLTGDKIYDALHVTAAIKGKAEKIHTSNRRDFGPMKPGIPIEHIGPSK